MKAFAILIAAAIFLMAQPATAPLTFEAATIKPTAEGPHHSGMHTRTGLLMIQGETLQRLVRTAYQLTPNQVEGGPKWTDSDRYDINAKSEGPAEDDELLRMLQSLLAGRFKLKFHIEKREFAGYALVVAKGGLKIHPVEKEVDKTHLESDDQHVSAAFEGGTLGRLADVLSRSLPMPVMDQTGITGAFTFKLEWARDDLSARGGSSDGSGAAAGPTIFTALQQQLGLKLESRKVPMDVYVIDSAEKPGEN
jgi:uncharacterized protein (TIGR03435 family)